MADYDGILIILVALLFTVTVFLTRVKKKYNHNSSEINHVKIIEIIPILCVSLALIILFQRAYKQLREIFSTNIVDDYNYTPIWLLLLLAGGVIAVISFVKKEHSKNSNKVQDTKIIWMLSVSFASLAAMGLLANAIRGNYLQKLPADLIIKQRSHGVWIIPASDEYYSVNTKHNVFKTVGADLYMEKSRQISEQKTKELQEAWQVLGAAGYEIPAEEVERRIAVLDDSIYFSIDDTYSLTDKEADITFFKYEKNSGCLDENFVPSEFSDINIEDIAVLDTYPKLIPHIEETVRAQGVEYDYSFISDHRIIVWFYHASSLDAYGLLYEYIPSDDSLMLLCKPKNFDSVTDVVFLPKDINTKKD